MLVTCGSEISDPVTSNDLSFDVGQVFFLISFPAGRVDPRARELKSEDRVTLGYPGKDVSYLRARGLGSGDMQCLKF